MAIEYNFTLDMDRSKRDNNIAYARTGDVDSITINADLVLNGAAYTPSGANAFFECVTPNGHSVRAAAQKSGSSVSVDVPSAAFQAAGVINVAYFRFETGSSDSPSYVESTEPFAIVVREGIGDNIDAGDYIEEWRGLADQLEAAVAEVEKKAEQAETAINEQKTEVDQLKAQAQVSIAQDAEDVSDAKDTAISNINSSQGAVDAAIEKLEQKTQEAVDAAQEALDGTLATNLQNEIDRTLKLDIADMTNIADNSSLSSLTNVGSYCCKTAASAATISDSPVDDSPFNMYVFSSATSGQVMQLVVPIDMNSKPTAEWHVRFGTSSAMDKWSVIGGGADIAAGLGIDVTGDAEKTVSLDTDAFYQHHEAASIIQGSTEVTGGGRIKELTVYGNTRQNLWVNPSGTGNGLTVTANVDGSVTLSGTAIITAVIQVTSYVLRPGGTYTLSIDKSVSDTIGCGASVEWYKDDAPVSNVIVGFGDTLSRTFTVPSDTDYCKMRLRVVSGITVSGTYRVMLNEGSEPELWCPPGLNSVDELSVVTAGKNLLPPLKSGDAAISLTENSDGTFNLYGTKSGYSSTIRDSFYLLKGTTFAMSFTGDVNQDAKPFLYVEFLAGSTYLTSVKVGVNAESQTFSAPEYADRCRFAVYVASNTDSYPAQVNIKNCKVAVTIGDAASHKWSPPAATYTPIDLDGHTLNSLPDGTCDELRIDGTGAVTLVQRVGVKVLPGDAASWRKESGGSDARYVTGISPDAVRGYAPGTVMSDALPPLNATDGLFSSTSIITAGNNAYASIGYGETAQTIASVCGGKTLLYSLATPQEVELPDVTLPDLASPNYTVYATSDIPAEIEAEVVKVDYLPPSDAYTREEVDKKIEDAGMPEIVPVSQGGTGVTTAAAERNRLGLGNTTGALPVANGGTGGTTAKVARYNLLNDVTAEDSIPEDSSLFTFAYLTASSTNGVLFKRTGSNVWNWIISKIRSTFGFSSNNVLPVANGGTGLTENPSVLVNLGSDNASNVLSSSPRPGVTGTLPVSHGGTGATAPGVAMLSNLGIKFGTASPPSTGTPGSIYIQYFK